jgi:heme A synthase
MLVHRFAIATVVATYLLILIGGLVHGTGSSLACPDWPTCYGTMLPKMEGGVMVEHSHRLAAGAVVLLTVALAVMLARSATPVQRRLRPFGWAAVALVFVQALLGGITVLLRLPTPVSTAHTAVSVLFFATVLYVAVRSRPAPAAAPPPAAVAPGAARLALVTAVAVYFQMVLGGLVRHSSASTRKVTVWRCVGSSAARKASAASTIGRVDTPVVVIGNRPGRSPPSVVMPANGSATQRSPRATWSRSTCGSAGGNRRADMGGMRRSPSASQSSVTASASARAAGSRRR